MLWITAPTSSPKADEEIQSTAASAAASWNILPHSALLSGSKTQCGFNFSSHWRNCPPYRAATTDAAGRLSFGWPRDSGALAISPSTNISNSARDSRTALPRSQQTKILNPKFKEKHRLIEKIFHLVYWGHWPSHCSIAPMHIDSGHSLNSVDKSNASIKLIAKPVPDLDDT